MKKTKANLIIELNVTCPYCDDIFDLFELDGGRLNDDGYLLKNTCPDGYWSDSHEKFEESVKCPECGEHVAVDGITW